MAAEQALNIEKIWSDYHHRLRAFLNSKVADQADAEDLLQEVLIKTHARLDSLRDNDSIQAWLYQVANRTVIDFYRKKGSLSNLDADDLWYEQEHHADVIEELSHCVEPFIRALPSDLAELLTAIDLEGQSQKDYAEKLGISYSTLKSRVQKGRKKLHELYNRCCRFSVDSTGNLMDFDQKPDGCNNC